MSNTIFVGKERDILSQVVETFRAHGSNRCATRLERVINNAAKGFISRDGFFGAHGLISEYAFKAIRFACVEMDAGKVHDFAILLEPNGLITANHAFGFMVHFGLTK